MNEITLIHINGKYYVYTVTHIDGKVFVNFERLG